MECKHDKKLWCDNCKIHENNNQNNKRRSTRRLEKS